MLSSKANDFFDDLKTLFKNSGETTAIVYAQIRKCSFDRIKQDIQTVHCRHSIIRLLTLLKIANIPTVHRCINSDFSCLLPFCKDLLYKVKNDSRINWRRILLKQAYSTMKGITPEHGDESTAQSCFILDDTDLPKRGKAIEWIGRIFSHVTRRYGLGFKCMNLTYWSGKHLLHLDFSLHIEPGSKKDQGLTKKELMKRYSKSRNVNSPGYTRETEVLDNKIVSSIKMMRRAIAIGFQASYILADSWFFCSKLVKFAISKNLCLVTRPKFNQWKYEYNGKLYTLGALVKKLRYWEKKKWNRQLRFHHISIPVIFQGTPISIFFYKEKKRGTPWQSIACTNRKLGAIQAYRIYQNRWSIEVSYKELKQFLGFGKCQSRDFDGQISDLTCCLMAYNHLSKIKALTEYQSIGFLFDEISKSWISPNLMQRFWNQLYLIIQQIAILVDKNFNDLLNVAMDNSDFLSDWNKIHLNLGAET
jgi:hypothetical protein